MQQVDQGLLSPLLRDARLGIIRRHIAGARVLVDLACGDGRLAYLLPEDCAYIGVDRLPRKSPPGSPGDRPTRQFVTADLADNTTPERLLKCLPQKADVVVLAAFVEHVKQPERLLAPYVDLLKDGGRIIGTTPHPCGRWLHERLAAMRLCSPGADEEHEDFLGRNELRQLSERLKLDFVCYRRFLCGLNQLFVFRRPVAGEVVTSRDAA